jgi:hypothetical protein
MIFAYVGPICSREIVCSQEKFYLPTLLVLRSRQPFRLSGVFKSRSSVSSHIWLCFQRLVYTYRTLYRHKDSHIQHNAGKERKHCTRIHKQVRHSATLISGGFLAYNSSILIFVAHSFHLVLSVWFKHFTYQVFRGRITHQEIYFLFAYHKFTLSASWYLLLPSYECRQLGIIIFIDWTFAM